MKAMILAAGRGERMRPLTDHKPKPLLTVAGKPLIQYQIEALKNAGIQDIVINLSYKGSMIADCLGDGERLGVSIQYSDEGNQVLETGGGIVRALPLLGDTPFIVVNGDVWTDYDYAMLCNRVISDGHLILARNPKHHLEGDFGLEGIDRSGCGRVTNDARDKYTFTGIGLYHPNLFSMCQEGQYPLAPILRQAIEGNLISGEVYSGEWDDIGTPERLDDLNDRLKGNDHG